MRRFSAFLTGLLVLLALSAPSATSRITEPRTGMSVKAAKGYKLSFNSGVYTLKGHGRYVQFTKIRSPLSLRRTGAVVLDGLKAKSVRDKRVTKKSFTVKAKVRRRSVTVQVTLAKGLTRIAVFGSTGRGRATSVALNSRTAAPFAHLSALSTRELAGLRRILGTARGEPVQAINIGIPMKNFVAPAVNGASASVPDLPGWQYGGTDTGYLAGRSNDGGFELGGFILVNYPSWPFPYSQYPTAQFTDPATALATVMPAWQQLSAGLQMNFTSIVPVPGTEGNLGAGYLSQVFEMQLVSNGVAYRGLANIGVTDNAGSAAAWGFYFSYAVERVGGPSGILSALLDTWGSWNNSAASVARVRSALATIASTRPIGGGPIDPEVFQRAADAWDEYIRGPE